MASSPLPPVPQLSAFSDPLALGRIQVLLVPVGHVSPPTWDKWSRAIKGFREIKLSQVPGTSGNAKGGRARYLPPSFPSPQTSLHLSFSTLPPDDSILPLSLFQVSLFPLAVIGITDLSETSSSSGARWTRYDRIQEFDRLISEVFPPNQVFPLTRRCFGVEQSSDIDDQSDEYHSKRSSGAGVPGRVEESVFQGVVEIDASDRSETPGARDSVDSEGKVFDRRGFEEKMVVIPKEGKVDVVLGMLMADVCASVLTELGEMVTALETPAGASTLQSSMLPTITVKPIPKTSTGRPRSVNGYSHLAVASNVIPPTRTPSPGVLTSGLTIPPHRSFSSSQPNLSTDIPPPIPAPTPSIASASTKPPGEIIKRSTTGLGFGSKVSRVVSGKAMDPLNSTPVHAGNVSNSNTGRLKKLHADFWLLSGRLNEAISSYNDAVSSLKSNNDHLWYGAALEGLATATMLEAWETRAIQSDSHVAFTASPILASVHDNLNAAYHAYTRTPCPPPSMFQRGTVLGETVMARLFSTLSLRHGRLLFLTWAAGGHGTPSLNAITYMQIPRAYPPFDYAHRRRVFAKLSTISRMARTLIANVANRAHGPWLIFLPEAARLEALVTLATLSRLLALERREAFFLREVVGTVMTMLGRRRALDNQTVNADDVQSVLINGEAPNTLSPHQLTAVSQALSEGKIAVRRKESSEGNEALIGMVERVCDVFGLDFRVSPMPQLGSYGWPELQVEIIKEAVLMTEALPDPRRTVQYCQMALRTLHLNLTAAAQYFLFEKSMRALETARRRGLELDGLPWWIPGDLLLSVLLLPIAPYKKLFEIQGRKSLTATKDVFLYNPRTKAADEAEQLVASQESVEVRIVLQNPFGFELDIKELSFEISGSKCISDPIRVVLGPMMTHTVDLSLIPLEPGELVIEACHITLSDGILRTVSLPSAGRSEDGTTKRERHRSQAPPSKAIGLGLRPSQSISSPVSQRISQPNRITAKVTSRQPMLVVKSTSLTHGSLIIYDGEVVPLQFSLENVSNVPVSFIALRFDDNLAETAREVLSDGQHSAETIYAIENEVLERPVLAWDEPARAVSIPPGGQYELTVRCRGKFGCETGVVQIEYGASTPANDDDATHIRQIACPILFTVRPTLRITDISLSQLIESTVPKPQVDSPGSTSAIAFDPMSPMDISRPSLKRNQSSLRRDRLEEAHLVQALEAAAMAGDHCLVQVDVQNSFSSPLEACLERLNSDENEHLLARRLVKPGAIERLYIPLPRLILSETDLDKPIPALSERQFVVDKTRGTDEEERNLKTLFWYKQALLSQINVAWAEPGSLRRGQIYLDNHPFSPRMLQVLRKDLVEVSLALQKTSSHAITRHNFEDVTLQVRHRMGLKFRPTYRIEALSQSGRAASWADQNHPEALMLPQAVQQLTATTKHIAIDGHLVGVLPETTNGIQQVSIGCCFLAEGKFVFRAAVYSDVRDDGTPRTAWFSNELSLQVQ